MATTRSENSKRIAYYYDSILMLKYLLIFIAQVGNFYYGHGHPMKPQRIRMAHSLILNYGLLRLMECYVFFNFYEFY